MLYSMDIILQKDSTFTFNNSIDGYVEVIFNHNEGASHTSKDPDD